MSKNKFTRQKHDVPTGARKVASGFHRPMREKAPCGASIRIGELLVHQLKCPQCSLCKAENDSERVT